MKKPSRRHLSIFCLAVAFLLLAVSFLSPRTKSDSKLVARRVESVLARRLRTLDDFAEKAFALPVDQWMDLGQVPEDMVVYRYVGERLQSWSNQFPVVSDDIVRRPYVTRYRRRGIIQAPFVDLNSYYTYIKLSAQDSYLVRRADKGLVTVVVGIKLDGNARLRLPEGYSIRNLHAQDGMTVAYQGQPVFKVLYESLPARSKLPTHLAWMAILFLVAGMLLWLGESPRLRNALISAGVILLSTAAAGKWLPLTEGELSQIAVILLINILVFVVSLCLYLAREDLWSKFKSKAGVIVASCLDVLLVAGIFAFTYIELFKIFVYTHISLDLTKLDLFSWQSAAVLATFLLMLLSTMLFASLMHPVLNAVVRREVKFMSLPGRLIWSLIMALYLVLVSTSMGFEREQMIISSWAESLANDRDNALEDHLKKVEPLIASDETIRRASGSDDNAAIAREHIVDHYLLRMLSNYYVGVQIGGESDGLGLESGTRIDRNSRFLYAPLPGQRSRYVGVFQYCVEDQGQNTVYISIEPKTEDASHSISLVLGGDSDEIPSRYSYAKYKGRDRLYFKGSYAYPTRLTAERLERFRQLRETNYVDHGYLHFVKQVSDDELIVISRQYNTVDSNLLALALVTLLFFALSGVFVPKPKTRTVQGKNSFKKTITILTTVSLTVTMAVLVTFSVTFVIGRNESNARTMMSDKTNSIRTMLQAGLRSYTSADELFSRQTLELIRRVGDNSGSDISLYRPDGKFLMSTSPELFEKLVLGSRLNEKAYYHIMHLNEGIFIQREKYGTRYIYTMYAPVMGADGAIAAIFSSPYMERNYDFQLDAATHTISIVIVFLILMLLSLALISFVVDKTFKPISEMSRKMEAGGVERLEYISYDRQDEISSLVQSYNRMVTDLTASTKALAQAERDKAWSEMARNVAHEIKNPLTPMRLQIQRIQRLKANGDPAWQSKFDDMAVILLDHIDVLTETANQFSDFARLYSEEPVEIKLDDLLRDEVDMYDTRPGVSFEYLGLPGVTVLGPRPQLVRVFVNLLNNAVQACEGVPDAKVLVSLRNGSNPDYYEMVFEDNGPGVDEENQPKLFTPKFTTKSSGSGLGLSICRSILERCGATIEYSRSFNLGGACFTIRYPKG